MQVSWIDAEEVRDFITRLEGPARVKKPVVPDLQTLPDLADGAAALSLLSDLSKLPPPTPKPQAAASAPAPKPPARPADADLGPDVSFIRERLRFIRDRAQAAGLLAREPEPAAPAAAHAASVAPAPSLPAPVAEETSQVREAPSPPVERPQTIQRSPGASNEGTIAERLDEFAQWAAKLTTSEETFMLDEHGELIWGSPTSHDLLIFARLALNATLRSHASTLTPPSMPSRMQIGSGRELHLIYCPTRYGSVALTVINPQQVPIATLREALALAVEK